MAPAIHEAAMTWGMESTLGYQEHARCAGQDLKCVESKRALPAPRAGGEYEEQADEVWA